MTDNRKPVAIDKVSQLQSLLDTAVAHKIAHDIHQKRKNVSVAERLNGLRERGWTLNAIKMALGFTEALMDLPLAAAADSHAGAESNVLCEPFGNVWIENKRHEIWLLNDPNKRTFFLKLGNSAKTATVLCDVRYELRESEYPGMFEIKGLTHGDIHEIIDTHSSPIFSGRFE
jgi:hypothetical protein